MGKKRIDRDLVVKTYKKLGRVKLTAEHLSISVRSVSNILKERNIPSVPRNLRNKKYEINCNFFKNIDTQEKAYILGFLYGDGCIIQHKSKKYSMSLEIKSEDAYILDEMKKHMESTHPLYYRKRNKKWSETATLVITNQKMCNDLIKHGMHVRKSFDLEFPHKMNQLLYSHFIRGLSDSDAYIGIDKKNRATWNFIGTSEICHSIKTILLEQNISTRLKVVNRYSRPLMRVVCTRKSDIIKLYKFLYNESTIHLTRKYDIFSNVKYKPRPDMSGKNNPFYGRKHTMEAKLKNRLAHLGKIYKKSNVDVTGENNPNSKLTKEQVIYIRNNNIDTKELVGLFGVNASTINRVKNGSTWCCI